MDKLDVECIRSTKAALKLASETRYKAEVDIIYIYIKSKALVRSKNLFRVQR